MSSYGREKNIRRSSFFSVMALFIFQRYIITNNKNKIRQERSKLDSFIIGMFNI